MYKTEIEGQNRTELFGGKKYSQGPKSFLFFLFYCISFMISVNYSNLFYLLKRNFKILGRGKKQSGFYRAPQSQPIRTHFPFSVQDFEPITFSWRLGHPAHRCRNRNQATDKTVVTVAAGWDRNSLIQTRERAQIVTHGQDTLPASYGLRTV